MHWCYLNTKSFRRYSAFKNTYWDALVGLEHKIFSATFSYQEYSLTCIGGTWTQNLFGEFKLSKMYIEMHWWDYTKKSFRRFSAIKKTYWHALAGLKHKIFSATFSYQEYSLTCIGGTWTQNLFGELKLSKCILTCIGGTLPKYLFGDFQLSRMLNHMHWWDLNTNSFRRFAAIKNTYGCALVGP